MHNDVVQLVQPDDGGQELSNSDADDEKNDCDDEYEDDKEEMGEEETLIDSDFQDFEHVS